MKSLLTLGIETSCDETALCLLETNTGAGGVEYRVRTNIVHSQMNLHGGYGGVVPMLAKREHIKNLPILYAQILKESGIKESEIDRIAVTNGPGLEPALWTGILFARELAGKLGIPVYPINHMEGHIVSSLMTNTRPEKDFALLQSLALPALALLISGGHTELVKVNEIGSYEILGQTLDDAVGEAFDKVARMMALPYPGGPEISKLAAMAREENIPHNITLPRPMIHSKDCNFSFSGLKTAVLYTLENLGELSAEQKADMAREFEDAVTEVIITKTRRTLEEGEYASLMAGGGVIANTHIRTALSKLADEYGIPLHVPVPDLTGDNALMIALAGSLKTTKPSDEGFGAQGNLTLERDTRVA